MAGWPLVIFSLITLIAGVWSIWRGMTQPFSGHERLLAEGERITANAAKLGPEATRWAQISQAKGEAKLNSAQRTARRMYVLAGGILVTVGSVGLLMGIIEILFLMR